MTKGRCAVAVFNLCFVLLGALQIATLLLASERPAQAYVDPGSGFVFLQVAGSMFAGAVYYLRHRLRKVFTSWRRDNQLATGGATEVAENQP